jgi:hypothetical protein
LKIRTTELEKSFKEKETQSKAKFDEIAEKLRRQEE